MCEPRVPKDLSGPYVTNTSYKLEILFRPISQPTRALTNMWSIGLWFTFWFTLYTSPLALVQQVDPGLGLDTSPSSICLRADRYKTSLGSILMKIR